MGIPDDCLRGSALEQRKREKRSELSLQADNTLREVGARQADAAYRDLQSELARKS